MNAFLIGSPGQPSAGADPAEAKVLGQTTPQDPATQRYHLRMVPLSPCIALRSAELENNPVEKEPLLVAGLTFISVFPYLRSKSFCIDKDKSLS